MPFSLSRLRFGRSKTPTQNEHREAQNLRNVEETGNEHRIPTLVPSRSRFRFPWLKKSAHLHSDGAIIQRPPTPTPYLIANAAALASVKSSQPEKLHREQPRSLYTLSPAGISASDSEKSGDTKTTRESGKELDGDNFGDNEDEDKEEDGNMSYAERVRLNSFASGLRGLIAELQRADEEARAVPPMKHVDGTPLSPITEAEEPELELDCNSSFELESSEETTNDMLSFTPLSFSPALFSDLDRTPTRCSKRSAACEDVPMPRMRELMRLPRLAHDSDDDYEGFADEERLDDGFALIASQKAKELDTETEDEQEYFSADTGPSPPMSSSDDDENDDDDDDDNVSISGSSLALRLLGLDLARPSSPFGLTGAPDAEDKDEEDEEVEYEASPTTPRARTQPQPRTRAITLASAHGRPLPALSPLLLSSSVPTSSSPVQNIEERLGKTQNADELMRKVTTLQREKGRLEKALAGAEKKIGEQSVELAYLSAHITTLRAALQRYEIPNDDVAAFEIASVAEPTISILVRAPSEDEDLGKEKSQAPICPEPNEDAQNSLSTPPATPDRRAACSLAVGPLLTPTPSPRVRGHGIVRRKSAGAAHSLRAGGTEAGEANLGIGKTQIKRRVGSVDLKSITNAWS